MDVMTLLGLLVAFGGIIGGFLGEGGRISGLISETAAPIILGGTVGAVLISFPLQELKAVPAMLKMVFTNQKLDEEGVIHQICDLSELARREGLIALEARIEALSLPLLKKGIRLIVDGIESSSVRSILEGELYLQNDTLMRGAKIFGAAGGYAPTMGIIGTVMGLISVLGGGLSNPDELAQKISLAFIATLYGIGLANLLFLPFEGKIKVKAARRMLLGEVIIEGVLAIQAGDHPSTVEEKLHLTYYSDKVEKSGKTGGTAA